MSVRAKSKQPRCPECGLHLYLCLCAEMPRIELDTRLVVIQHEREAAKPTSTAGVLLRMFPNSKRVVFGALDSAYDTPPLEAADRHPAVLFPRSDARPIEDLPEPPDTLIVLDGTWSQCSRMSRRADHLANLPFVRLTDDTPSAWPVRRSNDPTRICTFEAALRALALLEQRRDELAEAELAFQRVTARTLFMRARLPSPNVPADWPSYFAPSTRRSA